MNSLQKKKVKSAWVNLPCSNLSNTLHLSFPCHCDKQLLIIDIPPVGLNRLLTVGVSTTNTALVRTILKHGIDFEWTVLVNAIRVIGDTCDIKTKEQAIIITCVLIVKYNGYNLDEFLKILIDKVINFKTSYNENIYESIANNKQFDYLNSRLNNMQFTKLISNPFIQKRIRRDINYRCIVLMISLRSLLGKDICGIIGRKLQQLSSLNVLLIKNNS